MAHDEHGACRVVQHCLGKHCRARGACYLTLSTSVSRWNVELTPVRLSFLPVASAPTRTSRSRLRRRAAPPSRRPRQRGVHRRPDQRTRQFQPATGPPELRPAQRRRRSPQGALSKETEFFPPLSCTVDFCAARLESRRPHVRRRLSFGKLSTAHSRASPR